MWHLVKLMSAIGAISQNLQLAKLLLCYLCPSPRFKLGRMNENIHFQQQQHFSGSSLRKQKRLAGGGEIWRTMKGERTKGARKERGRKEGETHSIIVPISIVDNVFSVANV